jgi:H+/Cl- antiporter ClcA
MDGCSEPCHVSIKRASLDALSLTPCILLLFLFYFYLMNVIGSGIPECKAILSGIEINRFLNFKTFVAKVLGLIFAFAGGLSVGKEGPMVHICAIICSLLSKIPFFSSIRKVRPNGFIRAHTLPAFV